MKPFFSLKSKGQTILYFVLFRAHIRLVFVGIFKKKNLRIFFYNLKIHPDFCFFCINQIITSEIMKTMSSR